jgi:hypothetical protein
MNGNSPDSTNATLIAKGTLYNYNKSTAIYRCPTDKGRSIFGGKRYPRVRSYAMNGYMKGVDVGLAFFGQKGYKVNKKTADVTAPPPSLAFVFLDEHENSIDDGHFGFAPEGTMWMNLLAWVMDYLTQSKRLSESPDFGPAEARSPIFAATQDPGSDPPRSKSRELAHQIESPMPV